MIPSVLRSDNLFKWYGKRPILKGVSLSVRTGQIVGLLGPNGAGKTTCFSILCGLKMPDSGNVYLNDQIITPLLLFERAHLGISYLPQEPSIFRGLSVIDNIKIILETIEPDPHQLEIRAQELLEDLRLSHLHNESSLTLSGGERRRLEIARALTIDPHFLFLDEPLAGVDPISVSDIQGILLDLKKRGIGILMTDHHVRETLELVDYAYIIADGQVLASGTPNEIINNDDVKRVYLGGRFYGSI